MASPFHLDSSGRVIANTQPNMTPAGSPIKLDAKGNVMSPTSTSSGVSSSWGAPMSAAPNMTPMPAPGTPAPTPVATKPAPAPVTVKAATVAPTKPIGPTAPVVAPLTDAEKGTLIGMGMDTNMSRDQFNAAVAERNKLMQMQSQTTAPAAPEVSPTVKPTEKPAALSTKQIPAASDPTQNRDLIMGTLSSGYTDPNDIATATGLSIGEVNNIIASNPTLANSLASNRLHNDTQEAIAAQQKRINDIQNGVVPLSPQEQAQVDEVNRQFNELRQQQLTANRNYEGGVTQNEIRSGRQEFMNQLSTGTYYQAVSNGLAKIGKIDAAASAAVAALKQSFKDKDMLAAKESYSLIMDSMKDRSNQIKEIAEATGKLIAQDAENAKEDYKRRQDDIANSFKYADLSMREAQQLLDTAKLDRQERQDAIKNSLENDKWNWEQKQDLVKTEIDKNKLKLDSMRLDLDNKKYTQQEKKDAQSYALDLAKYELDIKKASAADNDTSRAEYSAMGGEASGKSYDAFLLDKGRVADKPPTADQASNAGYAIRMKNANNSISLLTKQFADKNPVSQWWAQTAPNFAKGDQQQMLEQAQRDFTNAILRRESGAAIAESEFANAAKQYFPNPGDSDAVIKQKANNRISALEGVVKSSGPALDNTFKQNISKITYPDIQTYIDQGQEQSDRVQQMINDGLDSSSIMQAINAQADSGGFSEVRADTNTGSNEVLAKVDAKADGTKGGQCGRFVNNLTGLGLGDSFQSKMAKMDPSITYPQPGDVFVMPYQNTGHTGIILGVKDGIATVKDSNWYITSAPEKVATHTIPISKMSGFARV